MSLVVGEEFEGECKETCWNKILEKTKKLKKKCFIPQLLVIDEINNTK